MDHTNQLLHIYLLVVLGKIKPSIKFIHVLYTIKKERDKKEIVKW